MKTDHYSKLLQILAQELSNFQKLLNTSFQSGSVENLKTLPLEQIINSVHNIETLAEETKNIQSLTLLNQDFTHFCFLLIDGSDMADYLLALDDTPNKIQKQARYWKDIAAKFRPFLKNSIYSQQQYQFIGANTLKINDKFTKV